MTQHYLFVINDPTNFEKKSYIMLHTVFSWLQKNKLHQICLKQNLCYSTIITHL